MPRPAAGRALFYTRDSMGRGECAPPEAVRWAVAWCVAEKVRFGGTPGAITRMMKGDISHEEDLFLDYGVSGNIFRRPGLDALLATAFSDKSVSHVLIPRRDRLARPDNPVDGLMLEIDLRRAGLCLVYQSKVLKPMGPAERLGLEEMLGSLLEFDSSGRFRLELADKLLKAQLQLAARGCSIGGSAPYGFERWLVGPDGTRTRRLLRGEHVRMAGHHTVWLPKEDGHELDVVRRIFELGWTVAPSRIAFQLTREGIPPPNPDGRRTSGVWHASAVRNILNNMIYLAIGVYGKRSEGDQLRFAPDGPRPLTEADFKTSGKLKCVVNPPEQRVVTPLKFAPVVTPEDFAKAGASLDSRRRKSRGAPRAHGDQWNGTPDSRHGVRVAALSHGQVRRLQICLRPVPAVAWSTLPAQRRARRGGLAVRAGMRPATDADTPGTGGPGSQIARNREPGGPGRRRARPTGGRTGQNPAAVEGGGQEHGPDGRRVQTFSRRGGL